MEESKFKINFVPSRQTCNMVMGGKRVGLGAKSKLPRTWEPHNEIFCFQFNPHPLIVSTSNVKKSMSLDDVANFFIFVKVFIEEHSDLFFVD